MITFEAISLISGAVLEVERVIIGGCKDSETDWEINVFEIEGVGGNQK
jgi:hypothetical protein